MYKHPNGVDVVHEIVVNGINRVAQQVQRDKRMSNAAKMCKANGDPKVLWELANAAVGKDCPLLPQSLEQNGVKTELDREAADTMNSFYIDKIDELRERTKGTPPPPPPPSWLLCRPPSTLPLSRRPRH